MNIEEIVTQKNSFKNKFNLTTKEFDKLILYLKNNDEPKHNTAVVAKLNNMSDYSRNNSIHVTRFFYDALNHARNIK